MFLEIQSRSTSSFFVGKEVREVGGTAYIRYETFKVNKSNLPLFLG